MSALTTASSGARLTRRRRENLQLFRAAALELRQQIAFDLKALRQEIDAIDFYALAEK
jgi:hypothetical protein